MRQLDVVLDASLAQQLQYVYAKECSQRVGQVGK